MTITMTTKNQITIPKKITNALGLEEGDMFKIMVSKNRIELVPLEVKEKVFTKKEYKKLDIICKKERDTETKVTKEFIEKLRNAK